MNAQSQGCQARNIAPVHSTGPLEHSLPDMWPTVRVLPGSLGPCSAACIGPRHLNQFPVSLHLGRDQGAEGVQVTSRAAEIFTKQRELWKNLCICVLGRCESQKTCSTEGSPSQGTTLLLQAISQGSAGPGISLSCAPQDRDRQGPPPSHQDLRQGLSIPRQSHL